MLCAIVAATNEETTVDNVLIQARRAGAGRCVVVVNGSMDETFTRAAKTAARVFPDFRVLGYKCRCGPDIPHAIGLVEAQRKWPDTDWYILLDGDLQGAFGPALGDWVIAAANTQTQVVWIKRPGAGSRLDQQLWLHALAQACPTLSHAEPAQVPRLVHKSAVLALPHQAFLHPGFLLAHCVLCDLRCAAVQFDGRILGNPARSWRHQERMQETLVGDALEGSRLLLKKKPHRVWHGKAYLGYHPERRFDLLQQVLQSLQIFV